MVSCVLVVGVDLPPASLAPPFVFYIKYKIIISFGLFGNSKKRLRLLCEREISGCSCAVAFYCYRTGAIASQHCLDLMHGCMCMLLPSLLFRSLSHISAPSIISHACVASRRSRRKKYGTRVEGGSASAGWGHACNIFAISKSMHITGTASFRLDDRRRTYVRTSSDRSRSSSHALLHACIQ